MFFRSFPRALPWTVGNIWALHNVGCTRHNPNKFLKVRLLALAKFE